MKDKTKGIIMLIVTVIVVAAIGLWIGLSAMTDDVPGAKDINLGLDLRGGVSVTYQTKEENPSSDDMSDLQTKLDKRATALSTEAHVYLEGNRRINVDIPGRDNADEVFKTLGDAGSVYFTYACDKDGNSYYATDESGKYVLTKTIEEITADGRLILDGTDVGSAEALSGTDNSTGAVQYIVSLTFKEAGTKKFADATTECYGFRDTDSLRNQIMIVYDNEISSVANVKAVLDDGKAQIEGQRSFEDAKNLATIIRIGALPLEIEPLRSNVVGATLGSRALKTSLIAGLIGLCLVCVYMIVVYKLPGLTASLSLVVYLGIVMSMLLLFDVTLTLPGIAGIILSVGMAVDANVIIFTRISEELATGKTVRSAAKLGFHKAASAILDGNITTLIAAIVLFAFGSGVIKGFATTLGIGIVVSMFTAFIVTSLIMKAFYYAGLDNPKMYNVAKKPKTLRIVQNWKKYVCISGAMIGLCIVMLIVNKVNTGDILNYGLDFVGGTSVQVTFPDNVPSNAEIEDFVKNTIGEKATVSEISGSNALSLKTLSLSEDTLDTLKKGLMSTYAVSESDIETETISGTVSGEMKRDAILAVVIATVCMLLYIWIRFKNIAFASSSVLALVHDVLVVLGLYAVIRLTVDTSFIACMLTIVGYSINATIVIFDRLRENLGLMRKKDDLADVVNRSISETFTRSIHTSVTTLITVVMLIILGVESVRIFAIPMAVGILCGGYSSVCIAGTLWYFFRKKFGGAKNEA